MDEEFHDWPAWVSRQLGREPLSRAELVQAETLREWFDQLGVDLEWYGSADEPTGVYALWKTGRVVGGLRFDPNEACPLFEGLLEMVGKVRRAAGQR